MKVQVGKAYESKGDGFSRKGDFTYVDMILGETVYFWVEHSSFKYTLSVEEFKKRFTDPMPIELGRTYRALKTQGHVTQGDIVTVVKDVDKHKYLSVMVVGSDEELPCPDWLFKRYFIENEEVEA